MSSRTGQKKSKAIDRSTLWSNWGWDENNRQWYRTRSDPDGNCQYETAPPDQGQTSAQQTPRQYSGTVAPVPTDTYYSNNSYEYQDVSSLSDHLQGSKISDQTQTAQLEPHYFGSSASTVPSQTSESGGTQPIDFPVSPARTTSSGRREYSASAPTGGYISHLKDKTSKVTPGYFPEESPGFLRGAHEERQGGNYGNYQRSAAENITLYPADPQAGPSNSVLAGNLPDSRRPSEADQGGSGAVTPKSIYKNIKSDTKGKTERLDPNFKVHSSKHFKPGHVFKILWSEPNGETHQKTTNVTQYTITETKHGEKVHSTIRRFVIVAADHGHCQCIPILTYQRQGVKKWGVDRDNHAIIYTQGGSPQQLDGEAPLMRPPIEMIPKTHRDKLEPASRINYAKIYTVEHNVKVLFIGHIAPNSTELFLSGFDDTWNKKRQIGGSYQG